MTIGYGPIRKDEDAMNKVLFTIIAAGLFFYGLYELTNGIALIGLFSWLVLVSVCVAWAMMGHTPVETLGYSRAAMRAQSPRHYTKAEWRALCVLHNNLCLCCGKHRPLAADHVTPLYLGGSDDISNIQPLCKSCNSKKGTRTIDYR